MHAESPCMSFFVNNYQKKKKGFAGKRNLYKDVS